MSGRCAVSVIVFVLNEEVNLPRCLDSLAWCDDVHVVDSFSTDATLDICERRGVPVLQHAFEGFGSQRNWALDNLTLAHDWVLILDADESVPSPLAEELRALANNASEKFGAFRVRRRFHMWGRWLRHSSLYPSWVVRFVHKGKVRYVDRGHAETQRVSGKIGTIDEFLVDENLKGIDDWFERQNRYSRAEAEFELYADDSQGTWMGILSADPLRRRSALKRIARNLPFRGTLYFLYCYIIRLGILDGRDGYVFCRMKAMYQSMVSIKKYDARRR